MPPTTRAVQTMWTGGIRAPQLPSCGRARFPVMKQTANKISATHPPHLEKMTEFVFLVRNALD